MSQRKMFGLFMDRHARTLLLPVLLSLGVAAPQPALAQFSDSYKFLEAVRKSDNDAVLKAIEQPGVTPVNTKDRSTGETALLITIARRDLVWTNYLLSHGARVDLADNNGRTPLMLAVEKRFSEGAQLLLARKASPNQTNNSGETPLMRAVQLNDLDMVRTLIAAGADATRKDSIAGMSAMDYAKSSTRASVMTDALTAGKKAAPSKGMQGPQL